MFNRNTSLLAGMSDDQARAALAKARAAYVDLAAGATVFHFPIRRETEHAPCPTSKPHCPNYWG